MNEIGISINEKEDSMKELPKNEKQKFQIGDICQINRLGFIDVNFTYPVPTELDDILKNRECIILYTYSQVFWGSDYNNYCVYLLSSGKKREYVGSYAWVEEGQMDFMREGNALERKKVIEEDARFLKHKNSNSYKGIFN